MASSSDWSFLGVLTTKADAASTSTNKRERDRATDVRTIAIESMAAEITPPRPAPSSACSEILLEKGGVEDEAGAAGNLDLREWREAIVEGFEEIDERDEGRGRKTENLVEKIEGRRESNG